MGLLKKSYFFNLKCPHCKEVDRVCDFDIEHLSGGEKYYWCTYCGEQSIYTWNRRKVRKMTMIEQAIDSDDDSEDGSIFSRNWLASVEKKDIRFEVVTLKDGVFYPPEVSFSFYESERYLKMMFHQTGFFPNVGDEIEGTDKNAKEGASFLETEKRFVIVMRGLAEDDYNTIQLVVVPVETWLEKQGW